MKTKSKLSAYILRGSMVALLFSCVIVALCFAINVPEQGNKAQDNTSFGASRTLRFAERVAYQTAIEDVYWRHRIWPATNPGPKPPLDKVMSQADIEKRVIEYLRNSQTLADYQQRPITADQLQAEMERMASNTRQPEVLQELFEALGNDPFVIAECLARPILAERLVREQNDVASGRDGSPSRPLPSARPAVAPYQPTYTLPVIASPSGGCTDDTWAATTTNAPSVRFYHTAVWTGSEMIVWGGVDGAGSVWNTGGKYNPSTDSWTATTTTNAPAARYLHTAVWTGSEMIVWGGQDITPTFFNTGGRYNPTTNSWIATSTSKAPSARINHTAVWTGNEMIVWGGSGLNTGGRYDPSTNSWIATNTTNAPSGRSLHTAVWTGSEMIVWGGGNFLNTGGRYDPSTNSWMATSTTNAPSGRSFHTAVWDDLHNQMIVWGGEDANLLPLNTGGHYNPIIDTWTPTCITNAPEARYDHTAVWAGSEMIVWGGVGVANRLNSGGRYPRGDCWVATSLTNAPSVRNLHTAVWTGSEISKMIVWGGLGTGNIALNTGGRYCAAAPSPTPTPTTSPTPTATATATATATPTPTPTATASSTPRPTPTPRPRPTPAPRP